MQFILLQKPSIFSISYRSDNITYNFLSYPACYILWDSSTQEPSATLSKVTVTQLLFLHTGKTRKSRSLKKPIFEPKWDMFLKKDQGFGYQKQRNLSKWESLDLDFSPRKDHGGAPDDPQGADTSPLLFAAPRVPVFPSLCLEHILPGATHHSLWKKCQ